MLGLFLTGCASPGAVDRENTNITIQVNHGIVEDIEQVEIKSKAAQGAVLGGLIGVTGSRGSSGDHVRSAAAGALIGGLLTRALEGSNKATAYTVRLNNGSTVKIITEAKHIKMGDCVAFETGKSSNIRKTTTALCEPNQPQKTNQALQAHHQEEAKECHDAKKQLLDATSEAEINAISHKVRVLCEH
jgi:hypothetical protein